MHDAFDSSAPTEHARPLIWLSWLLGAAMLGALVVGVLQLADASHFALVLSQAEPAWLLVAIALQGLTYVVQGQLYRQVLTAAGTSLPLWDATKLSLTKLFIDQALPSSGFSGAVAVVALLQRRGIAASQVSSCFIVSVSAYFVAYLLALGAALFIAIDSGHGSLAVIATSAAFMLFCGLMAIAAPLIAGLPQGALARRLQHVRWMQRLLAMVFAAEPRLTRNPRLLSWASGYSLLIVLLDALTLWALLHAVGHAAPFAGIFASFMLASVLRSVGIVPGGLGAFEAAAVATLSWAGVPLAAGLSATLLFRVLSFWLPMLPGFWLSRDALRAGAADHHETVTPDYWSQPLDELYASLKTDPNGLASDAAAARQPSVRRTYRPNLARQVGASLLRQLSSPLVLILLIGALVALIAHDWLDALIVLAIVIASALVGSLHEVRSNRAIARLREQVASRADVWRDGRLQSLAADEVVPGDIVELSAGSLIPADGRLVEARDCFVNQALLTGETFPVQKQASRIASDAALAQRDNCLFRGTSLRSGTARLLAVRCGLHTELGHIERSLVLRPPETEFERGLRQFGGLLLRVMLVMVTAVLGLNLFLDRPPLDTLMFAIALAVGLSPELLPAILSATLSAGARRMAGRGVIVRHLNAIENLGAMDTLCTDKTGTLTRGVVALDGALDANGQPSTRVLRMAWLNASLQTGLRNPLDEAIGDYARDKAPAMTGADKLDEIPYDFVRKRLSVLLRDASEPTPRLICKGALDNVLQVSAFVQQGDAVLPLTAERREALAARFAAWSAAGYRVLGLAWRSMEGERCTVDDEQALVFAGFLLFFDPPEPGVREELATLRELGVAVKIISGDNRLIARQVAESVGIDVERVITGAEIGQMRDEALINLAPRVSLFAEVDPNQKERIIRALQKTGHVVGFLGDGINDAPALHAADVGISVDNAVDVAKEAADFVLLRHELGLVRQGIDEGRRTFANTLKYIYLTTSAAFGNMISMAVASFFLPFLPLLAKQILLNNFLSDIPAIGIAGDRVDADWSRTPHRWDIGEVRRFMILFGLISSAFDLLTFGVLLYLVGEQPELFRSGWFVESLITELAIIFVVRTHKPFYRSRPGRFLLVSSLLIALLTVLLPYTPVGGWFALQPLPATVLGAVLLITLLYAACSEWTKQRFFARLGASRQP
ncbi:magnesium-translocating P-type ATPase [Stutzerimonas stutzeri]|uniref:magnesium-translocating P-type ATPase n=1 Tax=Stutzerimonas stutzeri TaxID=316 RepID=UPI00244C8649|nr:magnesium-translocating P-type ATPase [Stutzerimonas stutzeri]MDH0213113.1 magnesium-translocating P-type ATPase [Stutzerimonas stutzeri]MDH0258327.1 magnesium-translocating P-type ATPase [Stutzerimonas stutzeri]MDH0502275.1 magnesium-translocating P-type ATPase [Stutzerimonas stutzeri]